TRALTARPELHRALDDIQRITRSIVPWEEMQIARYDQERDELVVVDDISPAAVAGARFPASEGLPALAIQRSEPVVTKRGTRALPNAERGIGSEIVIPLKQGDRLVGLW